MAAGAEGRGLKVAQYRCSSALSASNTSVLINTGMYGLGAVELFAVPAEEELDGVEELVALGDNFTRYIGL